MNDLKLFLFNSLSITTGLLFFVFIMYVFYLIFYKENESEGESSASKEENLNEVMDDLESIPDVDEVGEEE